MHHHACLITIIFYLSLMSFTDDVKQIIPTNYPIHPKPPEKRSQTNPLMRLNPLLAII
jgi:hypothetical protein